MTNTAIEFNNINIMHPLLAEIFGIQIQSFWVMLFLGFCLALFFAYGYLGRGRRSAAPTYNQGLPTGRQIIQLGFWLLFGGIVGARVLYVLVNPAEFKTIGEVLNIFSGGMISFGSIIGISLAGYIYIRKNKLNTLKTLDIVFNFLPIVDIFQRIGCFLNGCCLGIATNSNAFGVCLPTELNFPYSCVLRHPFTLYLMLLGVGMFFILFYIRKRIYQPGIIVCSYLIIYSLARFFLEFLRDEPRFVSILPLNVGQYVCLGLLTLGIALILRIKRRALK